MNHARIAASLTASLLAGSVAACGSQSAGSLPSVGTRISADSGLADFPATFRGYGHAFERPRQGTIDAGGATLLVVAQLTPGYAGVQSIAKQQVVPAPRGAYSINMTFDGARTGNNEWATFDFYTNATGSHKYLGSQAGLVNVPPSGIATVHADRNSTLEFQALDALIQAGLVTAGDLAKQPRLGSRMAQLIASYHMLPDPSTNLFSDQTLLEFVARQTPAWQRSLNLQGATAQLFAVSSDAASLPDTDLAYNVAGYQTDADFNLLRPPGAPCGAASPPPHQPPANPPAAGACASVYRGQSESSRFAVYGGPILVGENAPVAPFKGITKRLAWRPPGVSRLAFGTMTSSQVNLSITDTIDAAFASYVELATMRNADAPPLVQLFSTYSWNFGSSASALIYAPIVPAHASSAVPIDTWNPWGAPPSDFQVCSFYRPVCAPVTSRAVLDVSPPFYDEGTNLKYFKWRGGGKTTVSPVTNYGYGYTIDPGSSLVATISSSTPTWIAPYQVFNVDTFRGTPGMSITITAVDAKGDTYRSEPNVNGEIEMYNVHAPTTVVFLTIEFSSHTRPFNAFLLQDIRTPRN
jgi:hypothetical protein